MAAPSRRILYTLILLTIASIGLVFGIRQLEPPSTAAERAFPYGEIRIGVDASFPPFAVDDGTTLYGLDIDLGNAIGAYYDVPVRFITLGYDGLYDVLTTDKADIVISALLINPLRTQEVRYTRHYFDNGLVLVSAFNSLYSSMEALSGQRLAVEFGSTADAEARYWLRRTAPFDILPYELPNYALDAVRLGVAEAALVDATTYFLYWREYPDWQVQYQYVTNSFYAIAMRLDRLDTWQLIEDAIWVFAADGTLEKILRKWL
jgi:polar amino acid transport system substrate-binding protein